MNSNIQSGNAKEQLEQMDIIVTQQNLIYYIQLGDTNVVRLLLMAGLNPNAIYQKDKSKWFPLHHSIEKDQLECTKLLLKNGANANLKDEKNKSPLFIAIESGNLDAVKILIEFGADLNQKGEERTKPLFFAGKQKQFEIHKLLKEYGAEEMTPQELKVHKRISRTNTVIGYTAIAAILIFIIFIVRACFTGTESNSASDQKPELCDCQNEMFRLTEKTMITRKTETSSFMDKCEEYYSIGQIINAECGLINYDPDFKAK